MPEPEPKPSKPHLIPFWKWLLLLLPSVIMLALPIVCKLVDLNAGVRILVLGVVLCFAFGLELENWLHGKIKSALRATAFGFLILFVNCFISAVGCAKLRWFG